MQGQSIMACYCFTRIAPSLFPLLRLGPHDRQSLRTGLPDPHVSNSTNANVLIDSWRLRVKQNKKEADAQEG